MSRQRLTLRINFTVIVTALVVTALDAASKAWARDALVQHAVHVVGFVWLRLQYNSGISFSFIHSAPLITTALTLLIALVVLVLALRAAPGLSAVGFGLLIGGGIANVLDRIGANPHEVTDFIAIGRFPVFNLADVAVSAGFVLLLVVTVRGERLMEA